MAALLQRIGIVREEVRILGTAQAHGRERLVSEALRPAAATDHWQERLARPEFAKHEERALASLSVVEAANADEEALAIAVALREVAETKDKTAALITPDRALARRVLAALARWNVPVDDSGGDALPATPAGIFARLVGGRGLRRACAGSAARAAQASAVPARRPSRRAHGRDHDARARDLPRPAAAGPAPKGSNARSRRFAGSSRSSKPRKRPTCTAPIRACC